MFADRYLLLLMDGASSSVIQNVLGHANYKTTERYIRPAIALAARKTLLEQNRLHGGGNK